jgi:hypothetical protein
MVFGICMMVGRQLVRSGRWSVGAPVKHMEAAEGGEAGLLVGDLVRADRALRGREHTHARPGGAAVVYHGEEVRRATDSLEVEG